MIISSIEWQLLLDAEKLCTRIQALEVKNRFHLYQFSAEAAFYLKCVRRECEISDGLRRPMPGYFAFGPGADPIEIPEDSKNSLS